jgi:hypothetical protein
MTALYLFLGLGTFALLACLTVWIAQLDRTSP